MRKAWRCVSCGGSLFRVDSDEFITEDGAIFCPATDEAHLRERVSANV